MFPESVQKNSFTYAPRSLKLCVLKEKENRTLLCPQQFPTGAPLQNCMYAKARYGILPCPCPWFTEICQPDDSEKEYWPVEHGSSPLWEPPPCVPPPAEM